MIRRLSIPLTAVCAVFLARIAGAPTRAVDAGSSAGVGQFLGPLAWGLTVVALGWMVFPLFRRFFGGLPDRGWFLARWAGLAFVGWGAWALSALHLVPFWPWSALVSFGILAGLGWLSVRLSPAVTGKSPGSSMVWIGIGELVFWGVFGVLLLARILNPDLVTPSAGGEKPMELAILNAVVRSSWFPPPDPWLAGHALNYYYFGFVPFAFLIRLIGIPSSVGFNLAIPTVGGFAAVGVLLAVGTLVRPANGAGSEGQDEETDRSRQGWLRVFWGPVLLLGVGNLFELRLLASGFRRLAESEAGSSVPFIGALQEAALGFSAWLIDGRTWPYSLTSFYWSATRVIPHPASEPAPITEFPLFSMLFADLHPHVMALPGLLFLILALSSVGRTGSDPEARSQGCWRSLLRGVMAGIVVLINPWELPLVLGLLLFLPGLFAGGHQVLRESAYWVRAGLSLLIAGLILAPHWWSYESPVRGVRLWHGSGTPLSAFLWIHGLFVFIIIWWLADRFPDWKRKSRESRAGLLLQVRTLWMGLSALVVWTILQQLGWISGAAWLATALGLVLLLLLLRSRSMVDRRIAGLLGAGCLLAVVPEFLALNGDVGRVNLVFKLYFEIWCLWSVACGACLYQLLRRPVDGRSSPGLRRGGRIGLALLAAAAFLYTPLGFGSRILDRMEGADGVGLDGLGALVDGRYPYQGHSLALRSDLAAIRWLQRNVRGSPVLVEAVTDDYGPGARFSSATGLSAVLGWPWHEIQQHQARDFRREVQGRREDIEHIYTSTRSEDILPLLERYGVRYVVVGVLERAVHPNSGLAKFEKDSGIHWDLVFESGDTALYEIRRRVQ